MKKCCTCKERKLYKFFNKNCNVNDGYARTCKLCKKKSDSLYYNNNTDKLKIMAKDYKLNHMEQYRKYSKKWSKKNADNICLKQTDMYHMLRGKVIDGYGAMCSCCGENEKDFLQIDHVNGGGRQDRKIFKHPRKMYLYIIDNNFPDQYQLLCANCNSSKGKHGYCIHKAKRETNVE